MKKALSFFILLFLSFHLVCYSEELLDLETLPTLRTKQYSAWPYENIIVFSAPRTGSSLVYNILRFLFEDSSKLYAKHNDFDLSRKVLRTHIFSELDLVNSNNVLYINTYRNPITASISHLRICTTKIRDLQGFALQLVKSHIHYLKALERMEITGADVQRFRYEDFVENLDYIFECIESKFNISIHAKDKDLIRKGYSKQSIYANTENFDSFNECLPISGFHGQHVNRSSYKPPKRFLYWLNIYVEEAKPLFRKYGYFSE